MNTINHAKSYPKNARRILGDILGFALDIAAGVAMALTLRWLLDAADVPRSMQSIGLLVALTAWLALMVHARLRARHRAREAARHADTDAAAAARRDELWAAITKATRKGCPVPRSVQFGMDSRLATVRVNDVFEVWAWATHFDTPRPQFRETRLNERSSAYSVRAKTDTSAGASKWPRIEIVHFETIRHATVDTDDISPATGPATNPATDPMTGAVTGPAAVIAEATTSRWEKAS